MAKVRSRTEFITYDRTPRNSKIYTLNFIWNFIEVSFSYSAY